MPKIFYNKMTPVSTDENTLALLHFDDENDVAKDECGNEWTVYGSPTITTTNAKFGKAIYFPATAADGLDCNFMLGGSDFTIDFWAYIKSSSTEIAWALYPPSGDSRRLKLMYYSGKVQCWYNSGNSVLYSTSSSSNKVAHYAFVWQQNLRKLSGYIDGTLVGSITTNVFSTVADSSIAFNQYSQNGACDYFDEFRISNCARWTENFTPPTAPYVLQTENRLVTKSIEVAE